MRIQHDGGLLRNRSDLRKEQYLKNWPIEKQLEAHAEAAMGRPEKLNSMLDDFKKIREILTV